MIIILSRAREIILISQVDTGVEKNDTSSPRPSLRDTII